MRRFEKSLKHLVLLITAICFWILIWQFFSRKINSTIFLPSPEETFKALFRLSGEREFWNTILNSFTRIIRGFFMAVMWGTILAIVSYFCRIVKILIFPVMSLIKAVPVASFIILALLWLSSEDLSVLIAFIMVLPVIYVNVLQGFENVDNDMLELAKVYKIPLGRRIRFIYIPGIFPAFIAACKLGLGFCFKSGIAAEVIGLPVNTIGGELYKAKLYLMTEELFAWTVVIIAMSIFFEGICIYLLNGISSLISVGHFAEKRMSQSTSRKSADTMQDKETPDKGDRDYKIIIRDISKSYGRQKVLDNVSMSFEKGKTKCIMGESGVGKTTLLKIMTGIVRPDKGDVMIGRNMRIAVVFQEDRLIEDTDIYTNIYFVIGKDFDISKADEHINAAGLKGLGRKCIKELSGGMKRRVAIIRAVMMNPDILILDEPFKGLDKDSKDMVIGYIKKYCGDSIVIMVSHDLEEAGMMEAEVFKL